MAGRRELAAVGALLALMPASRAQAEPRPAATGLFAEASLGGTGFVGDAASYSQLGPSLGARLGIDLFPWLSVGAAIAASTHEATVPPPPEGELYQLYTATADAQLTLRQGWFAIFAHGGAGLGAVSSNVLQKVGVLEPDERYSLALSAGGGVEYQLQNRHFALGLACAYAALPSFDQTSTVSVRSFLRYTY
jgi:hypothetical protein